LGRCLVPDLIGMGLLGKYDAGACRFVDHVGCLDAWFEALELIRNVTWSCATGARLPLGPAPPRAGARLASIWKASVQPSRFAD